MAAKKLTLCVIQEYLPPYRIPLFERISRSEAVDFKLFLMAKTNPVYPQWDALWRSLAASCTVVSGFRLRIRADSGICVNPLLLIALIKARPDVVVCGGFAINTVIAMLYKLIRRVPVVIWMEGTEVTEAHNSASGLRTLIRKRLAKSADGFIDAGELSQRYIRTLLPPNVQKPFFRSYNAIDSAAFESNCRRFAADADAFAAFRSRFPARNILFSGQLIERKNIAQMLKVYETVLARSDGPIGLIILGQGPLKTFLESEKAEKFEHLFIEGFIDQEEYYKYFAIADVFLLLSVYDCNPLVLFEALSARLPVVCSDRAGNSVDFIEDGRNGFVVDPFDTEDVAGKLYDILTAPNRREMGERSWENVQKSNYRDAAQAFLDAVAHMTGTAIPEPQGSVPEPGLPND